MGEQAATTLEQEPLQSKEKLSILALTTAAARV